MARKRGAKAKAVREYLESNPDAKAKDIVEALKAKKMKVTPNHVYYILGQLRSNKLRRSKQETRRAKFASVMSVNGDVVGIIHEVQTLAYKVGGYDKLRDLAAVLAG